MAPSSITAADIDHLALGCDLLGSGGGGSTAAARLIVAHHLAGLPPVPVISGPAPSATVACAGAMGSAAIMLESLPGPTVFARAVRTLENFYGPVDAIIPLEIGGVNGVLAVLVAATLDRPLVDADAMGRAFTHIHHTVLATAVPLTTVAFAGSTGGTALVRASDGRQLDRMLRSILPAVGGWGAIACHAGDAGTIVGGAVRGSVSRALGLGHALAEAMAGAPAAFTTHPGVRVVLEGTVVEVTRRPGVTVTGVASLQGPRRSAARIDFANEFVAAYWRGESVVSAPDIICVLDEATWQPLSADALAPHQRVRVVAINAPPELRDLHAANGDFGIASYGYAPLRAAS